MSNYFLSSDTAWRTATCQFHPFSVRTNHLTHLALPIDTIIHRSNCSACGQLLPCQSRPPTCHDLSTPPFRDRVECRVSLLGPSRAFLLFVISNLPAIADEYSFAAKHTAKTGSRSLDSSRGNTRSQQRELATDRRISDRTTIDHLSAIRALSKYRPF